MKNHTVLQLISSLGFFGAENVLLELAKGLSTTHFRPIVGVLKNAQNPHVEIAAKAKEYSVDTMIFECRSQFDLKAIFELRDYVDQHGVSIVHPHGYKADFFSGLGSIGTNIKTVATCHPWTETKYSSRARLYSWLDKKVLKKFDAIVAVAESVKQELLTAGVAAEKISVIDNGIDVNRFQQAYDLRDLCRELQIDNDRIIIGTVGRLVEEKGQRFLIEATKLLVHTFPNLLVIIVGEGPLFEQLNQMINELGLQEQVRLTGLRQDIPRMLALFDIFVLPSISEGLPMALMEAMASQKPVIATNVGDIFKLIQNGVTGLLITPTNVLELQESITKLIIDREMARRLAMNGYFRILKGFSNEVMTQNYVQVYQRLLAQN